jgi:hypothetical protein
MCNPKWNCSNNTSDAVGARGVSFFCVAIELTSMPLRNFRAA